MRLLCNLCQQAPELIHAQNDRVFLPPSSTFNPTEHNMNFHREIGKALVAHCIGKALAAHECGHAVCALANGVQVLKIQNGVRHQFTLYDLTTFPNTRARQIVSIAGAVAESDYLRGVGLKSDICSIGDAAHLLGHEESGSGVQEKYKEMIGYENVTQIARLQTSLNGHLMDGKELPCEFHHLLGLIKEARGTLTEHRNAHTNLVAALFDRGGVLQKSDIQRIWQAHRPAKEIGKNDFPAVADHTEGAEDARQ